MRYVILAATAVLALGYTSPAFAQTRSFADCWSLAEKSGATYGRPHRDLVARCMAGNAPMANAPPKQRPTPQLRAEARTFASCWNRAERQGGRPGGQHKEYVENCMAGRR